MWESERRTSLTMIGSEFRKMNEEPVLQQVRSLRSLQLEPSPWETLRLAMTPRRVVMANADRFLRQVIAESKKPFRERRQPIPPSDAWWQNGLSVMSGTRTEFMVEWPQTELALLEVALAVRLHRVRHGRWPARLAEIDRHTLPTVPRDLWGQPIAYRLKNGAPVVYSLGGNGKDDGGEASSPTFEGAATGDLVFGRLSRRR
jgi:hypothetical protein